VNRVLLLGVAVAALATGSARATTSAVDRLTLGQQVGQVVLLRFAGTTAPAYVLEALRERRAAGVILFRDNVTSTRQLRGLTAALRRVGGRPIVTVDQEGGDVRILRFAQPFASQAEQTRGRTVRYSARAAARALRASGVTVSLAPVADVPSVREAALAPRAFARVPETVSTSVEEAVRGWREGGVAATVKHFPGLGAARRNTDAASVTIARSRGELEATDLPPFATAIRAGVPLVMVGHARYPALDRRRIASQSKPIIEGLLRDDLSFEGVVVTDSMEAAASLATGGIASVCERAVRAGADLLLLTGRGSYAPVYRHLLAVARGSEAFRALVREAAARVLALKERGRR
jgi:beta-N-acetylhexosaminidase